MMDLTQAMTLGLALYTIGVFVGGLALFERSERQRVVEESEKGDG